MEDLAISAHKKIEGVVDRYKGMEITDLSSLLPDEASFQK
jgi:hypothetical protein